MYGCNPHMHIQLHLRNAIILLLILFQFLRSNKKLPCNPYLNTVYTAYDEKFITNTNLGTLVPGQ